MIGSRQQLREIFCKSIYNQDTALLRTLFKNPFCSTRLRNLVDAIEFDGYTALQWCCLHGYSESARVLIDNGAQIECKGKNHWTALHVAAFSGHIKTIKLLLNSCANLLTEDFDGCIPISLAKDKTIHEVLLKAMNQQGVISSVDGRDLESSGHCKCQGFIRPKSKPTRFSVTSIDSALDEDYSSNDEESHSGPLTGEQKKPTDKRHSRVERTRSRSESNILIHPIIQTGKEILKLDLEETSRDSGVYVDPEETENIFEKYQKFEHSLQGSLKKWQNYNDLHRASSI